MIPSINQEIGRRIRAYRKKARMTLEQLAQALNKSKATLSKYETGGIAIDIETLYQIAGILGVQVEQFLCPQPTAPVRRTEQNTGFFSRSSRFYTYYFDGRSNRIVQCVLDLFQSEDPLQGKTILYMNAPDIENCHLCENTYYGVTEHFDTLTSMRLKNQATPLETISINILAAFQEADQKWGLMAGVSFRPFVPIALKMLFSKVPLKETPELIQELKISREDIRMMKVFNMFSVS